MQFGAVERLHTPENTQSRIDHQHQEQQCKDGAGGQVLGAEECAAQEDIHIRDDEAEDDGEDEARDHAAGRNAPDAFKAALRGLFGCEHRRRSWRRFAGYPGAHTVPRQRKDSLFPWRLGP
jgi:hypothetical protein